jgi:glycosyltransferase involved in cell wall biosynthesis
VLVISAWEPWLAGHGGVWVLHHHLQELATRHEITVLAAGATESEAVPPAGAVPPTVAVRWFGPARPAGLDYPMRRLQGIAAREPAHVFFVERPELLRAARELVGGVDLLYAFGWGTGRLHRLGGAAVHTAIDSWDLGRSGRRLPGWRRVTDVGEPAAVRRHERQHYPQFAAVTVVADQDADHLRRLAPTAKIEVVTNGVDLGSAPAPLPTAPVLEFHGNFESAHNVEGAIALVDDIWPIVRRRHPDVTVLIAGRRPPAAVQRLAGDGVSVVADAPDLRPVLDQASVGVVMMSSGSGLKNKALETMAAGRPVVGNTLGLAGIGQGPGSFVAETPAGVAHHLGVLLDSQEALRGAGAGARDRAARDFSWAASARLLESVWDTAAGGG